MEENQIEMDLIERIKGGQIELFETLMEPYSRRLLELARCALRNAADADDVAQEVHLKAFTCLGQFRGGAKFSSWLFGITLNEIRQHRRRNPARRFVSLSGDDSRWPGRNVPSVLPDGLRRVELESARTAFAATLNRLPESMRSAVLMYHLQEVPLATTAARLGLTLPATKTRLFRARQHMRSDWHANFRAGGQR
ncbi:MAG TPA: RNA polymerase sigma factor [Bryobacteraceae bacterium]|nr:RNA polymerase sigma factor [Bryobacteraceae bacterium]